MKPKNQILHDPGINCSFNILNRMQPYFHVNGIILTNAKHSFYSDEVSSHGLLNCDSVVMW
jgi:hypothetical protein